MFTKLDGRKFTAELGVDAGMMALLLMPADPKHPSWRQDIDWDEDGGFASGLVLKVEPGYGYEMETHRENGRTMQVNFTRVYVHSGELFAQPDQVLVLSDPCYVLANGRTGDSFRISEDSPYHTACDHDGDTAFVFEGGSGLVCGSGYGDGCYKALIEVDEAGVLLDATVNFDEDADEDDGDGDVDKDRLYDDIYDDDKDEDEDSDVEDETF